MSHKALKPGFLVLLGIGLLVGQIQAAIEISVGAERLQDPSGGSMAVGGVLVLVGSTTDANFSGPSETDFTQNDDAVIAIWDIATGGGNAPGAFSGSTGSVSLGGDWGAGDPIAIYWFPTLTIADTAPGAAVPYGIFQGTAGVDGSDAWETPEDGTIGHNLFFITSDASVLSGSGSSDPAAGLANLVTPGTGPLDPSDVLATTNGPGLVDLSWTDNATDETGYRVERRLGSGGAWTLLDTLAAGSTAFADDTVEDATAYVYRVIAVRGPSWSEIVESPEVTLDDSQSTFLNLSNRAFVGTGDSVLIGSLIIFDGQIKIYAKASGPSLANANPPVPNALGNPTMRIVEVGTGTTLYENDDWETQSDPSVTTALEAANLAPVLPTESLEPAMVVTLGNDGAFTAYSFVLEGVGATEGFATIEIFDATTEGEIANLGTLFNLSNRALVGTGDEVLIASMIVIGEAPKGFFAKASGPSLANANPPVPNVMQDPKLTLRFAGGGAVIYENDDWETQDDPQVATWLQDPALAPVLPTDSKEPAMVAVVNPGGFGLYSLIVEGLDLQPGERKNATVEIFNFDPPQP
ncbi:MAG: hypothetical protein CMI18_05775 [Opitutaceae bacterium]|nr:hypothetical protein [Opitutaceae bacterium]